MSNNTPLKLEHYLTRLDKSLGAISISEKADIITEIRSHVLESMTRAKISGEGAHGDIDEILNALGEPEQVANRYLLERGLKPQRPAVPPLLKWLVSGLGIMLIGVLIIGGLLIWKFTPLVQVNKERVSILGGLVDVENIDSWDSEDEDVDVEENFSEKGSLLIDSAAMRNPPQVNIQFLSGKISLHTSKDKNLTWDCLGALTENKLEGKIYLNLKDKDSEEAKCHIFIPEKVRVLVKGVNGKMMIMEPRFSLQAEMVNGRILMKEAKGEDYDYHVGVINGMTGKMDNHPSERAYKMNLKIVNGSIDYL